MNYTVLARKYRSQDFNSLIGQDVLVKTLTTAINTGRIAHAFMFTGIRGTGKTSTARILAKALNCLHQDKATANPCSECENCKAITAGQHIDVIEIDAASHTGVDNMRDIMDAAQYRPTNGRYKVYIIDEVHMLSTSAFNALLKTLEEPPAHVIFILATTEIRKVPVTILSRCQRFDLARVGSETLKKHFANIAKLENVTLSDEANELIARAADGSVRDGLSLLDQAIAQTGGNVDETSVLNMLKRADRGLVIDFMATVLSGDTSLALSKVDEMYSAGTDLSLFLNDMMEWTHWATRMHPALRAGVPHNAPYTAEQRNRITDTIKDAPLNILSRLWQVMVAGVVDMQTSTNQKQCFDMLIVRMIHVVDIPPVADLIVKQSNQESGIGNRESVVRTTIQDVKQLGDALRDAKELMLLTHFEKNVEVHEFASSKIKFSDRSGNREFANKLRAFLEKTTGTNWTLEVIEPTNEVQTASEQKKAELESDPMVADALALFGGTIV